MPNVDLASETIIGCETGTKEWYHEEGHIVYNKSELGIKNNYLQGLYMYLTITFLVLSLLSKWIGFLAFSSCVMMWYYFNYEERWCWRYSRKKLIKI